MSIEVIPQMARSILGAKLNKKTQKYEEQKITGKIARFNEIRRLRGWNERQTKRLLEWRPRADVGEVLVLDGQMI